MMKKSGGAGNRNAGAVDVPTDTSAKSAIDERTKARIAAGPVAHGPPRDDSGTIGEAPRTALVFALSRAVSEGAATGDVLLARVAADAIARLLGPLIDERSSATVVDLRVARRPRDA
jgi:hypothetical protein